MIEIFKCSKDIVKRREYSCVIKQYNDKMRKSDFIQMKKLIQFVFN